MKILKSNGWLRFWEILLNCLMAFDLLLLAFFVWDGDVVAVISMLILFYVLLILRTGKVNYYNQKQLNR
jgi:hypothetical protein